MPPTLALKWATFMHDIGKYETFSEDDERIRYNGHPEVGADTARRILNRLKFPQKTIDRVDWLIRHHMMVVPLFEMTAGRRHHWFLHPGFEELLEVYRADALGIIPTDLSAYEKMKKLYLHEIAKLKLMPKSLISGKDVMKILNLVEGERVGEILKDIREKQLDGELKTKKDARAYLKSLAT